MPFCWESLAKRFWVFGKRLSSLGNKQYKLTMSERLNSVKPRALLALVLFLASLLFVGATSNDYGVSWDEPPYYQASDLHMQWLVELPGNIAMGKLGESVNDDTIQSAWHWNPYHVPHPPFSRIVSGLMKHWFHPALDKVTAYRLGPALFFAVLVTVMFLWMSRLFDTLTGLFSALGLILMPNLFGYAHLAVTDMPLASLWFLTAFCFYRGLEDWRWSVFFGAAWGLALATKFPALLIPVPLILWAHLMHRHRYSNNVFCMLFIAPIVMIAVQPYLWQQTGVRLVEFLYEGFSRGYRTETSFTVFYEGKYYLSHQLPRYYPYWVVAITTPLPYLLLAAIAFLRLPVHKEQRGAVGLFGLNALFVVTSGVMPGAVLHDGVRQLLSALPFLAALSGVGFFVAVQQILRFCKRLDLRMKRELSGAAIGGVLLALFSFSPALDVLLIHPYQLSYYNSLVGGIRGAYQRGLEISYFMEAINHDFLRQMNEKLPKNAVVYGSFATFMFEYYQREQILRDDLRFVEKGPFDFMALLNRRSQLQPKELVIMNGSSQPLFWSGLGPVPMVGVFDARASN